MMRELAMVAQQLFFIDEPATTKLARKFRSFARQCPVLQHDAALLLHFGGLQNDGLRFLDRSSEKEVGDDSVPPHLVRSRQVKRVALDESHELLEADHVLAGD